MEGREEKEEEKKEGKYNITGEEETRDNEN